MKFRINFISSIAYVLLCFVGLTSCQSDDEFLYDSQNASNIVDDFDLFNDTTPVLEKDSAKIQFAEILSRVIYDKTEVRKFLKEEASKKFDGNSDVLYKEVKDHNIGGTTFRNILISYSSKAQMTAIEKSLPYLNMFIPEITIFDVTLDNMDCDDNEIPVGVHDSDGMRLFLNGYAEITIPNGELPNFHSVVVNENGLIKISEDANGSYLGFEIMSTPILPNMTRSSISTYNEVGYKAATAFNYFNKDDGSKYSRALQRDYIYYGLTPDKNNGSLNYGVNEYISFMEVDPQNYFYISDQEGSDPKIVRNSVSRKSKDFTTDELIAQMWSSGTYTFRFELISSNQSQPIIKKITLRPEDLWDFNYDKSFKHGTWFRKKKYTYTIDPKKFTSKKVDLSSKDISFGKWDLSTEALERYVAIFEEDDTEIIEPTHTYEMNVMTSTKVNGSIKLGLGTNTSGEIGTDVNSSTSKKISKTIKTTKNVGDDALGTVELYFYDPIILKKTSDGYEVYTYNTGIVSFGLTAK